MTRNRFPFCKCSAGIPKTSTQTQPMQMRTNITTKVLFSFFFFKISRKGFSCSVSFLRYYIFVRMKKFLDLFDPCVIRFQQAASSHGQTIFAKCFEYLMQALLR